jgi:histidine ammonia-lyase
MTAMEPDSVTISSSGLTVEQLVAIASGAPVSLADDARARIRASRAVVDAALNAPELVYGLNTGLGHMRDVRLPTDVLRDYQEAIVHSHAGAYGAPLRREIVRAAMAARVNGIARGGSGASPAVADTLIAMLNARVHPVVPSVGSVGAADLMHMAAIALVATGSGRAEIGGDVMPGSEALRRAGIAPLVMEAKDGLALISANAVAIAWGALVLDRVEAFGPLADLVGTASMEAIRGNPSVVDPVVAVAKPVPGQVASAAHIRALLVESPRTLPGGPASVQDPISFRVMPQVHGALHELVRFAREAVELELNAMDDNPLVSIEERRLISNGNFHPMVLALAFDALRPAIAHVGRLSDLRLSHLWAALFADPDLTTPAGLAAIAHQGGGPLLRYAAATSYSALRGLAAPASLDVPALDLGVEDHATNAPETVRLTEEAADRLEDILAVELLTASTVLRRSVDNRTGIGTRTALRVLDDILDEVGREAPPDMVHATVRTALRPRLLPAVEAAIVTEAQPGRASG